MGEPLCHALLCKKILAVIDFVEDENVDLNNVI